MKKYPEGGNKKGGKIKRFVVKSALIVALSTGTASCNDSNTHMVKPGETIYSIYQQTDNGMTFEDFQIAFVEVNKGHIGIENGGIRANEEYTIPQVEKKGKKAKNKTENENKDKKPTKKKEENKLIVIDDTMPDIDSIPNEALDSLMQGETPIATYLKLYKAYEGIEIDKKPSFPAVIAHIEQETGMYGQWADSEFKDGKSDHFKHNNPFNITRKGNGDFYVKKDNIYKDGRWKNIDVKFNDYPSLVGGLEDYLKNITYRQYLLDHLGLDSIGATNPLTYLYKLESTGYMQGLLGEGAVDVYLSRQLNRPNNEKNPIFVVTKTDSTDEINYEVNKIIRLIEKESELKKGRNNFIFGETVEVDGIFMTKIVFKNGGNHNLKEARFNNESVKDQKDYARKSIDEIKEMK